MGATRNTGYLENIILYDSSDNVGIAGAVDPSYKVTLGGSLSGTAAVFSSSVTSTAFVPTGSAIPTNGMYLSAANTLNFATNSGSRLSISSTGAATFSSSVRSKGMSVDGTSGAGFLAQLDGNNTAANGAYFGFVNAANTRYFISQLDTNNDINYYYFNGSSWSSSIIKLSNSGAATFSSSVTAGGLVQINGSSNVATIQTNAETNALAIISSASLADGKPRIVLNGTSNTDANKIFYSGGTHIFTAATSSTEYMRINSSGNVGIGLTNPDSRLTVTSGTAGPYGTGTPDIAVGGNLGGSTTALQIYRTATTGGNIGIDAFRSGVGGAPLLLNAANGGSVYIGSTSGDYGKLDVTVSPSSYTAALGLGVQTNSSENNSVGISFKTKVSLSGAIWENARIAAVTTGVTSSAYGELAFYTMNATTLAERMRITSGGAVLVGTTSTTGLATGSSANPGVNIGPGASSFQVNNNSNIYLSKASGYTSGDFTAHFVNGTYVGGISTNGSSTTYATSSDYRLKTDLKDFAGIDIVNLLNVYDYQWISNKSRSFGVLAHELQSVLPDAVTGVKDGEVMQGVDYSKLTPILVKAIQEQTEIINNLESRIKTLESN